MFNSIRNLLWRLKSPAAKRREEEEAMEQGFHDLPSERERSGMSPQKLAILLAGQQAGTPAHILVEHELNLRIAQVQARATYKASYIGIVGAAAGAVFGAVGTVLLTAWLQNTVVKDQAEATQAAAKRDTNSPPKVGGSLNTPARPALEVPSVQPAQQPAQKQQASPNK